VRVDAGDNVWIVDQMSTQVIKFDPNGRVQMVLSRKPEDMRVPAAPLTPRPTGIPVVQKPAEGPGPGGAGPGPGPAGAGGGRAAGAGAAGESFQRPTDVAWDRAGNIYVADGYGNARIAKYDPDGRYIKSWGSRGTAPGQFDIVHGIAIDAQGVVYVADEGNKRIQLFDAEGTFKTQFTGVGTPTAICITASQPQYLYVAHTGDPDGMEDAAIYKLRLDGTIIGRFGSAGKEIKQFGLVNAIDCRTDNELLVGELSNWRVQKLTLKGAR
jgi:DNA-binding beta-propeller fold protein YncE